MIIDEGGHGEEVRLGRAPSTCLQFRDGLARARTRTPAGDIAQAEQVCRYLLVADKVLYRLVEQGGRKGTALAVVELQRQVEVVGLQRLQLRVTPATGGNATQVRRRARITGCGIDEHAGIRRARDGCAERGARFQVIGDIHREVEARQQVAIVESLHHRLGIRADLVEEVVVRCPGFAQGDRLQRYGFDLRLLPAQSDHDLHWPAADFAIQDTLAVKRQNVFTDEVVVRSYAGPAPVGVVE